MRMPARRGGSPFWYGFCGTKRASRMRKGIPQRLPSAKSLSVKSRIAFATLRHGCPSSKSTHSEKPCPDKLAERGDARDRRRAVAKRHQVPLAEDATGIRTADRRSPKKTKAADSRLLHVWLLTQP